MLIYLESNTSTTSLLSSPPTYKNSKLEEMINREKHESTIRWNYKQLSDNDMEIIAYYLLINNKVSKILFLCHC